MPLRTIVKVSHISNLSDARYCAGMGVEMLGFRVLPGHDHYMTPEVYQDIRGWISGPGIIAEMYGLSDPAQVEVVVQRYAPDYFELSYAEYLAFREILHLPCIVYAPVAQLAAARGNNQIRYWVADEDTTCKDLDGTSYPVLKVISSLKTLNESLRAGCYKGVVLEGPREERPGVTNYEQLGTLLETLED